MLFKKVLIRVKIVCIFLKVFMKYINLFAGLHYSALERWKIKPCLNENKYYTYMHTTIKGTRMRTPPTCFNSCMTQISLFSAALSSIYISLEYTQKREKKAKGNKFSRKQKSRLPVFMSYLDTYCINSGSVKLDFCSFTFLVRNRSLFHRLMVEQNEIKSGIKELYLARDEDSHNIYLRKRILQILVFFYSEKVLSHFCYRVRPNIPFFMFLFAPFFNLYFLCLIEFCIM